MARTVVGIFDDTSKAREAQEQLIQSGISRSNVDLSSPTNSTPRTYEHADTTHATSASDTSTLGRTDDLGGSDRDSSTSYGGASGNTGRTTGSSYYDATTHSPTDFGSSTSSYAGTHKHQIPVATVGATHADPDRYKDQDSGGNIFDRIGSFFSSLFDSDDDARRYSEVSRGRTILTVHTNSWEEAERAADIMDECGAIDTDNQTDYDHASGTMDSSTSWNNPESRMTESRTVDTDRGSRDSRRSRIFERPVDSQHRLNEDYDYKTDWDEDFNTPQSGNRKPML